MKLSEIKCLLLDMDGTVYLGDRPIGGVGRTLSALRERGIRLIFSPTIRAKRRICTGKSSPAWGCGTTGTPSIPPAWLPALI